MMDQERSDHDHDQKYEEKVGADLSESGRIVVVVVVEVVVVVVDSEIQKKKRNDHNHDKNFGFLESFDHETHDWKKNKKKSLDSMEKMNCCLALDLEMMLIEKRKDHEKKIQQQKMHLKRWQKRKQKKLKQRRFKKEKQEQMAKMMMQRNEKMQEKGYGPVLAKCS